MAKTSDRLGSIYNKPFLDGLSLAPEKALYRLKREVLKQIRSKLVQSTFSERAKRAFAQCLKVTATDSTLVITATHPAFIRLLKGQKPGQMKWLVKARAPIPIITETGELIFRSATPRSMENGSWYHPGRAPQDFIQKAKDEARKIIRQRVAEEIRRVVLSSSKRR